MYRQPFQANATASGKVLVARPERDVQVLAAADADAADFIQVASAVGRQGFRELDTNCPTLVMPNRISLQG